MKKIWKKCFRQKNQLFLLLLLTIIQCKQRYIHTSLPCSVTVEDLPGDQKGLFKLAVELRKFFNSVICNTAPGYVLLVYLTNI
jgi:hypothetical protein